MFAPKEMRSLRALEASRILLVLAPWPGRATSRTTGSPSLSGFASSERAPSRYTTDCSGAARRLSNP